ncbi:MAG: hypothetical protein ACP5FL_03870 [Thermoplasmatota archaeon]
MIKRQGLEREIKEEWTEVGQFADAIIEANGDKRRLVKDGRILGVYLIEEE